MFKIYLAGAMSGLTKKERNEWRQRIQKHFSNYFDNVVITNPCDFYDLDIVDSATTTEKEIMEFDLHKVRTSDLIIVNLTHPNSIGTSIELFLANQLHIPVISYGIPITQIHPWIELMLTKQCVSEKDMLDYITCYYIGRGKI